MSIQIWKYGKKERDGLKMNWKIISIRWQVTFLGTVLLVELQTCYCAGTFLAVIILSVSIIDAQLRETEAVDNKNRYGKTFRWIFYGKRY